jgi:hypothetical protein
MTQFGFFFSLRMLALPWLSLFTMEKTIGATGHPSSWSSKQGQSSRKLVIQLPAPSHLRAAVKSHVDTLQVKCTEL